MTSPVSRPFAVATVPSIPLTVTPTKGSVTLDAAAVPYAAAELTMPLVDHDVLELLDPRDGLRMVVEAGDQLSGASRTFDLGIRKRTVDHKAKEVTLRLAGDEALCTDYVKLVDDSSPMLHQDSLRDIIDQVLAEVDPGAGLAPGSDDPPFYVRASSTNLVRNPRAANDTTDWAALYWPLIRQTAGGPGYAPTYVAVQSGGTGLLMSYHDVSLTGDRTYRLSCDVGADLGQEIGIDALVKDAAGTVLLDVPEVPVAKNAAPWQRLSVTFTAPANATKAELRVFTTGAVVAGHYLAATAWRLSEVTDDFTDVGYFDGGTPGTSDYVYGFSGTPYLSPSSRTALVDRAPDLLVWRAGVSAWDFLEPLAASAGLKLWCDESRVWRLANPAEYDVYGVVSIAGWNAAEGTDTIGRDDAEVYCTAVLVIFRWTDSNGVAREATDSAGTPGRVLVVNLNRAYTGPGIAAAILSRRAGTGRLQDVAALARWDAAPYMEASISLPGTEAQIGQLTSVEWGLTNGLMRVGSRGLTEAAEGTWRAQPAELDWDEVPADLDWEDA